MKIKDKIRFFFAKILLKKTVIFSAKDDWEWPIRKGIVGYVPFFYEFDEINPNDFDVVFPLTLRAQRYINCHRELFAKQLHLNPSDYCIELCDDKKRFHSYLSENGFQKFIPIMNGKFDYPYVLKKKVGLWGEGISIISDKKSEIEHINEIESDDYCTQQYIKGKDEYTSHIIVIAKTIVFFKALKFTFQDEYFIKGKDFTPISVEEVDHEMYKPIFEEILLSMDYEGICCFDYKVTEDGLSIFEINPRFGASMSRFINEALNIYGSSDREAEGASTSPSHYPAYGVVQGNSSTTIK